MSQKKAALRRWDILADVIKSKNCPPDADGSKRCFQSYNILHMEPCEQENGWKRVSYRDVSVRVRYLPAKLNLSQLVGFNNTGNGELEIGDKMYISKFHFKFVCGLVKRVWQSTASTTSSSSK